MEQQTVINVNNKQDYKMVCVTGVETLVEAGIKEGLIDRIDDFEYGPLFEERKQPPKIMHQSGNEILFKGFKSTQQQKKFKELKKVTAIWYEEAEDLSYEQFKALQNQLRGGKPEDRVLYLSLNPMNPDGFIDKTFFQCKPEKVFEWFEDGRPKVYEVILPVELDEGNYNISVLVVCSTYKDNKYLTDAQKAAIVEYKDTRPDLWEMLGLCKFVYPEGTLIKELKPFSLKRMNRNSFASMKAVVDTATSGSDSATLKIYGKIDDRHHFLLEAIKSDGEADESIRKFAEALNKFEPQRVYVEENHEGLYFIDKLDKLTKPNIFIEGFRSTENKHEKILSQSGRIKEHLYVRDDGSDNYNECIQEVKRYNKDPKKNKHDDCIDNMAMYFKHAESDAPLEFG